MQEMVSGVSLSMHRFMVMELVSSLYRFAVSNRINTEPIFGEDERLFRNVTNMDSKQLTDWLCNVSLQMQDQMQSNRADGAQTFVSKAVEYVRDNYSDQELTIDKICGILGISAAYFFHYVQKRDGQDFYRLSHRLPDGAGGAEADRERREDICDRIAGGICGPRVFQLRV